MLDSRRQLGYSGGQPLTIEGIILYGQTHGFLRDMRFFTKAMCALDGEYMKRQAEESRRKRAKKK